MKRESVLTEKDKESIEIVQFIFHIIIEKQSFFCNRLVDKT